MRPGPWLRLTALAGAAGDAARRRLGSASSAPVTGCSPRSRCRRSPRSRRPPGSATGACCPLRCAALALFGLGCAVTAHGAPPRPGRHGLCGHARRRGPVVERRQPQTVATRSLSADYVTLTKPRIMTLLLLTGFCGMVVGAGGLPSLGLAAATMAGLALACGGASALNHVLDADIDRLMGKRTRSRPVAAGTSARAVRARVRARPLRVLVRPAGRGRQRPDRRARPRRQPLLRARLHAPA